MHAEKVMPRKADSSLSDRKGKIQIAAAVTGLFPGAHKGRTLDKHAMIGVSLNQKMWEEGSKVLDRQKQAVAKSQIGPYT